MIKVRNRSSKGNIIPYFLYFSLIFYLNTVLWGNPSATQYLDKAKLFKKNTKWDSTYFYINKALPLLQTNENYKNLADLYRSIGNHFIRSSIFDSAIYYVQFSIDTAKIHLNNPHTTLMKGYNSMSIIFGLQGDYGTAIKFNKLSLSHHLKGDTDNLKLTARLYNNIGINYERVGEIDSAIYYTEFSLKLKLELYEPTDKALVSTYNNMGILYQSRGYNQRAVQVLKMALNTDEIDQNINSLVKIYHNLGIAYKDLGDLELAESHYLEELSLTSSNSNVDNLGLVLTYIALGNVYNKKTEHDLALIQFQNALELLQKFFPGNKMHLALLYNNIGFTYHQLKRYDQATKKYNQSKLTYELLDYLDPQFPLLYSNLGNLMLDQGNFNHALVYFNKALEIRQELYGNVHSLVAMSYNKIGELYFKSGNFEKAYEAFNRAYFSFTDSLKSNSKFEYPNSEFIHSKATYLEIIQNHIKTLIWDTEDLDDKSKQISNYHAVLNGVDIAIQLIHDIRETFLFSQSKLILTESTQDIYKFGVRAAYALFELTGDSNYKTQVFQYAEYSQGSILWEALNASKVEKFRDIPNEILDQEYQLKADITYYLNALQKEQEKPSPEIDVEKIEEYRNGYFRMVKQYDNFIEEIQDNFPNYSQIKHPERKIMLDQVQNTLNNNEALIEFFIDTEDLYIICIKPDDIAIYNMPKSDSFHNSILNFNKAIRKIKKDNFLESGRSLSELLISPLKRELENVEHLLIIPSGVLTYLPFESLPIEPDETYGNNSQTNYLINRFTISYLSSADSFFNQSKNNTNASKIIGFAPIREFTPYYENSEQPVPLPYSAEEIENVKDLCEQLSVSVDVVSGNQATEESFKTMAPGDYDVIHIATHGILNEKNPDLSALIFRQNNHSNEDGILYASEIYNLQLNSNLTILSSCDSGGGKMVNGEGILSLSRAFIFAGTENIIFTLWPVGDKSSNYLITKFYENIMSGLDYSQSLRQAKLSMIANKSTAAPRNWSGYILMIN